MRPKLLVITPRFPYPLYAGDLLRIYRICEALKESFSITLLSICQSDAELNVELPEANPFADVHRIYLPKWKSYLQSLRAMFTGESIQIAYYSSEVFRRKFRELSTDCEYLLCHLIRMAPYADDFSGVKALELTDHIPLTYERSNSLSGGRASIRRLVYTLERGRVEAAQSDYAHRFDLLTFVSELDRAAFLASSDYPGSKVRVFGNGVDLLERPFIKNRTGNNIAFIGTLNSLPNSDAVSFFIENVLPIVRKKRPNAHLKVIGFTGSDFIKKYSSPAVTFTGPVSSLADAVRDCVIGVCPVRIGAGIQNKLLDYMSLGLPAITTSIGAEGLPQHFLVADTSEAFASSVLQLFEDDDLRSQIALRARAEIEKSLQWSAVLGGYAQAVASSKRVY